MLAMLSALCLVILMALPASALSLVPPENYNERYDYGYIDYNRDGVMELVVHGGEAGEYTDAYPAYRIFANVDGKAREFTPAEGRENFGATFLTRSYRNRFTFRQRWFSIEGFEGWTSLDIYQITFDFENLQYSAEKVRMFENGKRVLGYPVQLIRYGFWKLCWKQALEPEFNWADGKITDAIIEDLLLHPRVTAVM